MDYDTIIKEMELKANSFREVEREQVYTVEELLRASRNHLRDLWRDKVWVTGELSNVRKYASGHVYMTLKDGRAEVSCIMYSDHVRKQTHMPKDGAAVKVLAEPTIYVQRGRFQLSVHEIKAEGIGLLHEKFVQTKEELRDKGWFSQERKREIARIPSSIAVVVSLQGAVWRDIKKTLGERFPLASVKVFEAPAQGDAAAMLIAEAIARAGESGCDTMLVCRGGGSFEDLFSYNEIEVAEAILNSGIPVVTGIGHETDVSIADMVADLRAATPTAAAYAAVSSRVELLAQVEGLGMAALSFITQRLNDSKQRLDMATSALLQSQSNLPSIAWKIDRHVDDLGRVARQYLQQKYYQVERGKERIAHVAFKMRGQLERISSLSKRLSIAATHSLQQKRYQVESGKERITHAAFNMRSQLERISSLSKRLSIATMHSVKKYKTRLDSFDNSLDTLSPRRTLERGYALVTDENEMPRSKARQLKPGESAVVNFADGGIKVKVRDKEHAIPGIKEIL